MRKAISLVLSTWCAAMLAWAAEPAQGPRIAARHTLVMTQPPQHVPSGTVVDGPILGNGDLGIALGGPPEEQRWYFGKNDFWSLQASPMSVGGMALSIPELAGATYRQEQDIAQAEVRGTFTKGGLTVRTRTWVAAAENLAVTELGAEGGSISVTAALFPYSTELKDNRKGVHLGREQNGSGRWYFDGLLDEIRLFDRAVQPAEVRALAQMQEITPGLVRRWKFEADEGKTPVDTPVKVVLASSCPGPPEVFRPNERPVDEPTRCRPDGYHLDYQRYGVGKRGRAVKLMHEAEYVDAGQVPALQQVSIAAWIYVFKAGDANFILSKGDWNEAYSLLLDHGRLRFNIGNRFVRSARPVPAGQWVHVAGTFDGNMLCAYIDGEEVLPRARYVSGGAGANMIWRTRNADGPLDEQSAWENPLAPTNTVTTRGREVTYATRLIGAEAAISEGAMRFTVKPGIKVYLVTPVLSDLDAPEHLAAARSRAAALAPDALDKLSAERRQWWTRFWSESYVEIGDPLIERFYYSSQYMIASASRAGKVAPGLYGNWVTTDHPSWNGDYTLNYNHETPVLALYASNHIAVSGSYEQPVLDLLSRAKQYARTIAGVRGVLYPGHIGPWGTERPLDYDPFMGQKHVASFVAQPMLMRFYSTYDTAYAHRVYPFLLEVGNFWEDDLKFEDGRYVVYEDCIGEVGPWKTYPNWDTCAEGTKNTLDELTFLRSTFQGLIDISTELGMDAERRAKWQHILDHLSAYPTEDRGGKTVLRGAENSPAGRGPNLRFVWPNGQVGLGSDPKLLQIARDSVFPRGYSAHPMAPPALARLGFDPAAMLEGMRKHVESAGYPNGYIFFAGGGVETASPIPGAVNEMLLQSYQGVLRLFPNWPKDRDARFGQLRAYGAFLISSELSKGEVKSLVIESEKGRPCTLQNPWPGKPLSLSRNGGKPERLSGATVTFKTSAGERLAIKPE